MNILFLVFSFVLMFLFFSSYLIQQTCFFSSMQKRFCLYIEEEENLRNKWEKYKYRRYDKPSFTKDIISHNKEAEKKKALCRNKEHFTTTSQWNISSIFFKDKPSVFLAKKTADLFEIAYGLAPFWQGAKQLYPDLSKRLVDSFIRKGHVQHLFELFPEEMELQRVFYFMLKGSGIYDVSTGLGYPPLEDLICIHKEQRTVFSFADAHAYYLQAFFGREIADKVMHCEEEKVDGMSLTKQELQQLLLSCNCSLESMTDVLEFHKKKPIYKKLLSVKDGVMVAMTVGSDF